jgi:hypothetical protein
MEERIENVAQGHRGDGTEAEIPRVSSGLHSEDSVIDIESGLPTETEVPESPEPPVSEPPNAVITPDGVQELPPWLIGSDGKPLPINERTLRLIRGKTFTVRHIALTCGHKMDLQNQPKTGCETCWWEWLNNHSTLVQTAHEFYQQFGKERLVAMRGTKFVKYFLMFMSTVAHMIEEQKKLEQEKQNGEVTNTRGTDDSASAVASEIQSEVAPAVVGESREARGTQGKTESV